MTRIFTIGAGAILAGVLLTSCAFAPDGRPLSSIEAATRLCGARGLAPGSAAQEQCLLQEMTRLFAFEEIEDTRDSGPGDIE